MKKNKLRYLGFLGLLGLLGLVTGNYGFFGFFGFFAFFGAAFAKTDELLRKNINRAGLNGFVVATLGLVISMVIITSLEALEAAALLIAFTFVISILTFTFSLHFYEK